ncbi:hypothetical protein [Tateyamaria omphalii]|uniref:LPS export ABC transporter periplasmic protein LptC n=1 Tax=Tateyamaria omphalii TaxID=299262 RepID=A0A1P8MYM3_9RHOB|nr:hypothetical protein [Tateyamaria omphalii]APX13176.1 hypothetical protein BWR18_16915 [Tateyamaria omphalii]
MDRYSKLVAWLKVLLPLAALALLSTLFLLSRNIDPVSSVPFAETEIQERLQGQQVTAPFFSGTSSSGDRISVSAGTMATADGQNNAATDLAAHIDLAGGTRVVLFSDRGAFDMMRGASSLEGNVVITTSTGYKLNSEELLTDFERMTVESPGPVNGTGLSGTLKAGHMRLEKPDGGETAQLIFTNGVKLIYRPQDLEEE